VFWLASLNHTNHAKCDVQDCEEHIVLRYCGFTNQVCRTETKIARPVRQVRQQQNLHFSYLSESVLETLLIAIN
jgi:hypothetical protein